MTRSRSLNAALGLAALVGAASRGPAFATTYDFSYNFVDHDIPAGTITGSFTGTGGINDISVTSVLGMSLNGSPLAGPFYALSYTPTSPNCGSPACFTLGGAIVSNDSSMSDFIFSSTDTVTGWGAPTFFYVIQPWDNPGPGNTYNGEVSSTTIGESFGSDGSYIDRDNGQYYPQNFSVSAQDPGGSAVPEPATWAMMLAGFAGLGFAAWRRTSKGPISAIA